MAVIQVLYCFKEVMSPFLSITLKGLCHEDFAILGQFCAKIITFVFAIKL